VVVLRFPRKMLLPLAIFPLAQQVLRPSVAVYMPAAKIQMTWERSLLETWAGLKQGLKALRTAEI